MNNTTKLILPALTCLLLGMLVFVLLSAVPLTLPPELAGRTAYGLMACLIIFSLCAVFLRYEKLSLTTVHLIPNNKTLTKLGLGLLIGAVIVGAMLFVLFAFTDLNLERNQNQTVLVFLIPALAFIPLALMEELLFRGYPFFRLAQVINIRWVLLITATLFALYHYNGTQNVGVLLLGPGIWGVTFGVAAYLSKSIAVPLGIHISANVLQALFGLKSGYVAMWEVTRATNPTASIEPDHLGLTMQLVLLVLTLIVLEFTTRNKKLNHLGTGDGDLAGVTQAP